MSQIKNKYQIIQKISDEDTVLLHPETDADVVEYSNSNSGLKSTTVQGAIDEVLGKSGVTGVKGGAEGTYRTGNVNITAENIGAEPTGAINSHNSSNSAHSDIRSAISNTQTRADNAYALAEGKANGTSYANIQAFITAFNSLAKTIHKVGDAIYIQTIGVPDFWVYSVESSSTQYTYVSDKAFVEAIKSSGSVKVGYYKISISESDKVDFSEYQKSTDSSLETTDKTITGAINEVRATANTATSKANTNATDISNIKSGTTKVGSSSTADTATSASKLSTARTIGVTVGSGTNASGATITGTGSQSFDGSANKTITANLGDSGVTAGTYSAIQVNSKGIAVAGGQMVEIGASGQSTPSSSLATGGLFFKVI